MANDRPTECSVRPKQHVKAISPDRHADGPGQASPQPLHDIPPTAVNRYSFAALGRDETAVDSAIIDACRNPGPGSAVHNAANPKDALGL
jgi:hypothetical protein